MNSNGVGMEHPLGRNLEEDQNIQAEELAVKAACGDSAAFEALYKQYKDYVSNTALNVVHRREYVEDISQQVWAKLFLKLQHYIPKVKFSTWLYSVTKHAAIDYLRRVRRSREVSIDDVEEGARLQNIKAEQFICIPIQNQEMDLLLKRIREKFSDVLESMSKNNETRALCFRLFYFHGKSVKEISNETNVSEVNVKWHLHVARKYIQKEHPELSYLYRELVEILGKTLW